jgi:hypothetical protein
VAAAVAVAAASVGVAGAKLVAAVGAAEARVGAGVTVGTLAVVGVAPLVEHAATVASSPPMRAALAILGKATVCPII